MVNHLMGEMRLGEMRHGSFRWAGVGAVRETTPKHRCRRLRLRDQEGRFLPDLRCLFLPELTIRDRTSLG